MQITKLKSIENLGIFKKFPKNSDEKIFKRYNLIYGWNGSGKTTLSKLFQFIEWGGDYNNIPEICEPEFYKNLNAEIATIDPSGITLKIIDGQTNQTDIINSLNVRVFNSVFIENNIDWNGRTKEIVIGQASKNAKEDIEKINTTINTYYDKSLHESGSPIYIKTLKDKYDTCIQKISNFSDEAYLTDTAAKIYNKAAQGTMYNNYSQKSVYNKADLKRFLSINHTKEQIQSKTDIKTDDEINNLSYEIKHATEKPVFTYNFDPKTFHELFFFDVETIKKEFIGAFVTRIIYTKNQLTLYLNTNPDDLAGFMSAEYINQNTTKTVDYIVSGNQVIITVPVILRPFANTRFNKGNDTILTVSENNNLIVKAFATAWCYREMYEECGDVDTVARKVGSTPRTIYRYLDIAYMNPKRANQILSGKLKINFNDLFQIARENQVTIL